MITVNGNNFLIWLENLGIILSFRWKVIANAKGLGRREGGEKGKEEMWNKNKKRRLFASI